jgi:hypothetical protein
MMGVGRGRLSRVNLLHCGTPVHPLVELGICSAQSLISYGTKSALQRRLRCRRELTE